MRSRLPLVVLLLAGCTATDQPSLEANRELPTIVTRSCERPARRNCTFINTPVRLEAKAHHFPESPFPYFRTRNELKFVDAYARHWVAPAGTWTDGASI
ncbi:MAG TPA: hypothetical protein ENK13_02535, partial [Thermopetrobacter sp.]|nr:hypothetical protein [Thermopetrobacter sp.]